MNTPLALAATCLFLLLSAVPRAQAQSQPRLPCDRVVRMGLDRYFALYTAATHDESTAGSVRACDSYARCRRHVSDAQARALSVRRRGQIAQARMSLDTLAQACGEFTFLSGDTGTMLIQFAASAHASREDLLAALIADLRRPAPPSPSARRQAADALQKARRSLDALRSPHPDAASATDRSGLNQYESRSYPAALAAFARLQGLVKSLPDVPARRLARAAQQELARPAQNLHDDR